MSIEHLTNTGYTTAFIVHDLPGLEDAITDEAFSTSLEPVALPDGWSWSSTGISKAFELYIEFEVTHTPGVLEHEMVQDILLNLDRKLQDQALFQVREVLGTHAREEAGVDHMGEVDFGQSWYMDTAL